MHKVRLYIKGQIKEVGEMKPLTIEASFKWCLLESRRLRVHNLQVHMKHVSGEICTSLQVTVLPSYTRVAITTCCFSPM
jgi:hypothetical protein